MRWSVWFASGGGRGCEIAAEIVAEWGWTPSFVGEWELDVYSMYL